MRWPDAHGCADQAEHDDYIDDLTERRIAALPWAARLRRWWWINWPAVVTLAVLVVALGGAVAAEWRWWE